MFIGQAFAAEVGAAAAPAAGAGDAFWFNMGLIAVMFVAFYFILIRPQQRRLREQQEMIDSLKKGDRVITAGGLVGKITKLTNDREVEIELAKDIKVTALRYTLQADIDKTPANASKKATKSESKSSDKDDKKDTKDDKSKKA